MPGNALADLSARASLTSRAMRIDWQQIVALFILAVPIACVARTVVFEEIFREPREYCREKSNVCRWFLTRKFFYLFTCEYCFSHYLVLACLLITHYRLLFDDWRGYIVSFFSLVFVSNIYLNLYSRLRVEISHGKKEIEAKEKQIAKLEAEIPETPADRRTIRGQDYAFGDEKNRPAPRADSPAGKTAQ